MKVRELFENSYSINAGDINFRVGVKSVHLQTFVPEEEYKKILARGVDFQKFEYIPVAIAGNMQRSNVELLDAFKEKKGFYLDRTALTNLLDDTVLAIGTDPAAMRSQAPDLKEIQDILRSNNKILISMPSGQEITRTFARKVQELFGGELIDSFKKNPFIKAGDTTFTQSRGYEKATNNLVSKSTKAFANKQKLEADLELRIAKLETLMRQARLPQERERWKKEIEKAKVGFKSTMDYYASTVKPITSKSLGRSGGKAFNLVDMFIPKDENTDFSQLNGKDIVLIDYNIDRGKSMAWLTKAILLRATPNRIVGVAMLALK